MRAQQTWVVEGRDGDQSIRMEVPTGWLGSYQTDAPASPGASQAKKSLYANRHPGWGAMRALWPGGAPLLVFDAETREADFLWNAGAAGTLYGCRVILREPNIIRATGTFQRSDSGRDQALGSCTVSLKGR
ncbi:hypothetical protein [Deinococcus aluminii]|uniref:Uncharacterized protein n=1 Tax=Deinococcus aluminii TaxID=1656885 RepID=A0ABP9XDB6_9DEIO